MKLSELHGVAKIQESLPLVGVWIEIDITCFDVLLSLVTPLGGSVD